MALGRWRKTIESDAYEHNFYMLDGQPTGPNVVIRFPFDVHATQDLHSLAETRGHELVYLKELTGRETAQSNLTGFGSDPRSYDITVENTKTGAAVRQTCDRPLVRINYWSIRSTACPEAYLHMKITPGETFTWRILYERKPARRHPTTVSSLTIRRTAVKNNRSQTVRGGRNRLRYAQPPAGEGQDFEGGIGSCS